MIFMEKFLIPAVYIILYTNNLYSNKFNLFTHLHPHIPKIYLHFKFKSNTCSKLNRTKKLDNIFKLKLFKKTEGLVVCKSQAASPLALLWFDGYCNNPNILPVPAWSILWIETFGDREARSWIAQRNFP